MENMSYSGASSRAPIPKAGKRRIWSPREEELLILALKEIIQGGYKCENGFRTGYLKALEKILKQKMSNTDLRAEPHIGNKIHVWKKNHGSLQCMLARSGFEWDHEKNMAVFDDESIWEDYIRTDKHATTMKNKSYPLYKDWSEIFGKDKATGEFAEDLNAADHEQLDEEADINIDLNAFTEGLSGENEMSSPSQAGGSTSTRKSKGKKRRIDDSVGEQMVNLMGKFAEQTNENLQTIGKRIGYEVLMCEKREKLFEALGKLGVLNLEQQILAAKVLINNNKDLELFFSLPEDAQARMVTMMATGRI